MKNKMITQITTLTLIFISQIFSQNSSAAESLNTTVHNQYQSLRAMGMGNAFTTVADDYTALMYNPATLTKKKRGEIQFTLAGVGTSANTAKIMKDLSDADKNAVGDTAKATAISNVLDQYYGKPLGGRIEALEFFWVRPYWGAALIPADVSLDMSVNRQLGPALDLNIKVDSTLAYGYAKEITPTISGGILGKVIHRASVEQTVSAVELAADSNVVSKDRLKDGINVDAEIGFLWKPEFKKSASTEKIKPSDEVKPEAPRDPQSETVVEAAANSSDATVAVVEKVAEQTSLDATTSSSDATVAEKTTEKKKPEPETPVVATPATAAAADVTKTEAPVTTSDIVTPLSVSFVTRNIISSDFSKSKLLNKEATQAPSKNPRVIDIGVGYDLATWGDDLKLILTAEAKNLLHPNTTVRKSTHAGFEFDYSPGTWFKAQFRAGLNQMYFTAGMTLLLGVVEIDAVTYGEEVGTNSVNVENRVNAIKLGFNF